MGEGCIRKDIFYLYKKLAKINTTGEQLIFLEQEKNIMERLFNCLKVKKISLFNYASNSHKRIRGANCPEFIHVSVFIKRIIMTANMQYRNSYGHFSFIYGNKITNYVLYRKYRNYLIELYQDYIQLLEKELIICNEKLKLGIHITEEEKYLDYIRKIAKVKRQRNAPEIRTVNDKYIDLKSEELFLYRYENNKHEGYEVLFMNAAGLAAELDTMKDENDKIILLMELKKDIKKILLDFADIDRTDLRLLRITRHELLINAREVLFFIEFVIEQNNNANYGKLELTADVLYEKIKRKMRELEKLNSVIKNEINYLYKKKTLKQGPNCGVRQTGQEITELNNYPNKTREIIFGSKNREDKRKMWRGTKGEFAVFVNDHYLSNQKKYHSLRDAAYYLYEKYRFNWSDWTKERCYDYVKKK